MTEKYCLILHGFIISIITRWQISEWKPLGAHLKKYIHEKLCLLIFLELVIIINIYVVR